MKEITIEKRSGDYKAYLTLDSKIWGCGQSPDTAIGDMIQAHPEKFRVRIVNQKKA